MECPTCDTELSGSDKRAGPEEPEVGWEYYVCPECGDVIHPARLEQRASSEPTTSREEFTGTVVQSDTPIILDDGKTNVQADGLNPDDVRLGNEVTIVGEKREPDEDDSEYAENILTDCTLVDED